MSTVGQSIKRFEDHRLLTGVGSFVDDIRLPDMLHASVVRSPHPHALIRKVDTAAARSLPGVAAAISGQDLMGVLKEEPPSALWSDESVLLLKAPGHPVLATDRVCYVGQAVVMVVAETLQLAQDAAELVIVDYDALPAVVDPFDALKDGAEPIHKELGTNLAMHILREGGDLDDAFTQADRVIKQRFEVQRLAPAPLEARAAAAHYQPHEDMLTVWDSYPRTPPGVAPTGPSA